MEYAGSVEVRAGARIAGFSQRLDSELMNDDLLVEQTAKTPLHPAGFAKLANMRFPGFSGTRAKSCEVFEPRVSSSRPCLALVHGKRPAKSCVAHWCRVASCRKVMKLVSSGLHKQQSHRAPRRFLENFMKAFQDQCGTSIPPKELPAQSYFETLEEMVQDRVFYAESLAQVFSLDTENKHRLANPDTHSQHIAMLFDVFTIRPKRLLVSTKPEDPEGFRAKYEIVANVRRIVKLRSPGRAVLVGLTENTWETHRRWLMDSKRFAMELEVAPGVLKAPG